MALHRQATPDHTVPAMVLPAARSGAQLGVGCMRRWFRSAPRMFPLRPSAGLGILRLSNITRVGGGFRTAAVRKFPQPCSPRGYSLVTDAGEGIAAMRRADRYADL